MEIRVHAACARAAALADHARRRLLYVLRSHQHQVEHVEVRLGDTRSRRGAQDGYCKVQLRLVHAGVATVVDVAHDIHEAIDRAIDRAGRAVTEHLAQLRGAQPAAA
ncbi:HPF/RaiA family ribosome-associated protein [Azohydromonas aeria]|uniref:HPF/RaiA family ribosome-associated protein n=1 Tax=Azohydromonas aeria TaxID=2590212 RepID=UPI0012FB2FB1|nr:HPF/RaiA family ribosome-associated protein [Azohydromonas aeria]